jgi:2-methylisocitrate lyase-like PEP mutase family enzyme
MLANMVEGGATPISSAGQLEKLGFKLVIFPGGTVRFLARQMEIYFASLNSHGTTAPMKDEMFDFDELNDLIGTPELLEAGKDYGV